MDLELVELGRLNDAQRTELEGDEVDPFGAAGNTLTWRLKDHHVALKGGDGRLVASAGLVLAEVEVGGTTLPVVGLGGVFVAAPYRGRGLSTRVITEALARARKMGPEVIFLFCHRDRVGLYLRHGFTEIAPPVQVDQPDGPVEIPMVAMWRPVRDGVSLPEGRVSLRSLPF